MPISEKKKYEISDLLEIMALLRSENGCPWDKEQNHKSIRNNFLEEAYEAVEAIDNEDSVLLREELGDVLLQVVFHAQIEQEAGRFDFSDVTDELCRKLIERHPHVFGEVHVRNSGDVLKNWDSIKQKSKGQETFTQTLKSIPVPLPALMRAEKIGKRAARAGYDFPNASEAFVSLKREAAELEQAMQQNDPEGIAEELGDVLFSCVNTARKLGFCAEELLDSANAKFIARFEIAENLILADGKKMTELSAEQLDFYWQKAKKK